VSDAYLDLASDRLDVAVRIGEPAQDPGLIVRKLAENRRIVVASHAYLERMGTPTAPVDLAAHQCLRFPYRQGRQSWVFSRDGHTEKVEVNGRLTANSLDILRDGVLNGQGIALVPTWLVQHDIAAGEMLPLFDAWSVQPLTGDAQVYAAYLPNRRHSRKVQTFIAFLAERIRGALAE
jgi:DNA-binding transcriptional LysR family regulator